MEIERQKLRVHSPVEQPNSPEDLRARQLRARDLLRGDLEGADLDAYLAARRAAVRAVAATLGHRQNSWYPSAWWLRE